MMRKFVTVAAAIAATVLLQGCGVLAVGAAGAGAMIIDDRRTTGTYVEDENIEWKIIARMRESFSGAHVNGTSYNRRVLLTGEAYTEGDKQKIEEAVKAIPSVREVANELQVAGASSLAAPRPWK